MKRFMNKKVAAVGLAVGLTLAGAGAAFAYFTSTGNGTGQGFVGSASNWTVTAGAVSGTIYPGAGSETITFTIKNNSSGAQALDTAVASVNSSGGNITQNGVALSGCSATWFAASAATPASGFGDGHSILGGASTTDVVTVTM